ncbi:PEPxxWA-CTERM sorting domain-containing protein [Rugamonas sp. A1-17]|nr:PEPxxWA-CTERM sorting domain-containing protein [Rugamonas sp. A1-17]
MRPQWTDFIVPGNPGGIVSPPSGYTDHNSYIFASEYWGNFFHVDINDYADGRLTDGVNGQIGGVPETIYVRNTLAVPEPGTWAMLMAGLGLVGVVAKRRKA